MRLLVVDDSIVFRHLVEAALAKEADIEIVGTARNGRKAIDALPVCRPELLTLDMEMPEMDGLATLAEIEKVNAARPRTERIGVILLSSHTRAGAALTLRALDLGAFDFITKPEGTSEADSIARLRNLLLPRIRAYAAARTGVGALRKVTDRPAFVGAIPASQARESLTKSMAPAPQVIPGAAPRVGVASRERVAAEVVCIGVSTGGPRALAEMLPTLCEMTTLPILIVQHMPANFTASLAAGLQNRCGRPTKEGEDGEFVEPSRIYIAPGGRHMTLTRSAPGQLTLRVNDHPPENGCRPSVDVLFRSVAAACRGNVVAVIMTGMGNDGEQSLRGLKREGARVIVQDEETSVVWGMPGSAVASGFVDEVVPLMQIPHAVRRAAVGR